MERRAFIPALAAAAVAAAVPAALAGELPPPNTSVTPRARKHRGRSLMHTPRFEALSMEGKRLIEYARPFLKKLPKPGPGMVSGWLLAYDDLGADKRRGLEQLLVYVEYMSEEELHAYLGADGDGRVDRQVCRVKLMHLAREARIPYHTGAKLVITSYGPWANGDLPTAPPGAHVLPHAARDLMAKGTYYAHVTGAGASVAARAHRVLRDGAGDTGRPSAVRALLQDAGLPREAAWAVLGHATNPGALVREQYAPYVLSTRDATTTDEYLKGKGVRKRMREARTPEQKRALRKEMLALRDQALVDLHFADRFPTEAARRFLAQVLFSERGVKDRGNTFVHVGGLRAMQLLHPKFLYIQFGGPDAALRGGKHGRTFGEQGAVGQGNYTDADYLADLDQWSYYHWLEAQQHPHYKDAATFVLLFGPGRTGDTQAIVTGPGVDAGARVERAVPLATLLHDAVGTLT